MASQLREVTKYIVQPAEREVCARGGGGADAQDCSPHTQPRGALKGTRAGICSPAAVCPEGPAGKLVLAPVATLPSPHPATGGSALLVREPEGLRDHLPDDAGQQRLGGDTPTCRGRRARAPAGPAAMTGTQEPASVPSSPLVPVLTLTATAPLSLHAFASWVSSFTHKPSLGLSTPRRACRHHPQFTNEPAKETWNHLPVTPGNPGRGGGAAKFLSRAMEPSLVQGQIL